MLLVCFVVARVFCADRVLVACYLWLLGCFVVAMVFFEARVFCGC